MNFFKIKVEIYSFLLVLALNSISINSKAQTNNQNELKLSSSTSIPIGRFASAFKTGFGIGISDYIPTAKAGSFLIHVGYNVWNTNYHTHPYKGTIVSLQAGYRYK